MSDVYQFIKDLGGFLTRLNKQKVRKFPIKKFERMIEVKIRTRLSKESKEEIIQELEYSGEIKVVTGADGKEYVITGKII